MRRFLLYIDFLGFSDLVAENPKRIDMIYQIINSLNVHAHEAFKTIVFSDTVLVYNSELASSERNKKYLVMYACEFVQDLQRRLVGQGVFFRAVLVFGEFEHYKLNNVECFYGGALIKAYLKEKDIAVIGMFIDDACNQFNDIFEVERFDDDLSFVYLNQSLECLQRETDGDLPASLELLLSGNYPDLVWDIRYLKDIHSNMQVNPSPRVRAKYLMTWHLFRKRYRKILDALEDGRFSMSVVGGSYDWTERISLFEQDLIHMRSLNEPRK